MAVNYPTQQKKKKTCPLWQTCAFLLAQPTHAALQVVEVQQWVGPDNVDTPTTGARHQGMHEITSFGVHAGVETPRSVFASPDQVI